MVAWLGGPVVPCSGLVETPMAAMPYLYVYWQVITLYYSNLVAYFSSREFLASNRPLAPHHLSLEESAFKQRNTFAEFRHCLKGSEQCHGTLFHLDLGCKRGQKFSGLAGRFALPIG